MNKVFLVGIGGIGISALARYYKENGWQVFGSDKTNSELIDKLKNEGINIIIGEDENRLEKFFKENEVISDENSLLIYTEAISKDQKELIKAKELGIKIVSYAEGLAILANKQNLIAITGTHGKSTTTSLTSLVLKNSSVNFSSVVGTLLKEFGQKNFYHRGDNENENNYFVIEACEYKRSFLRYKPYIGIITNIEIDHLDYYKDLEDYLSAFKDFLENIIPNGYALINLECENSKKLLNQRNDINYILLSKENFIIKNISGELKEYNFPIIKMQVPGEHILFDAKIAYVVGIILGIEKEKIIKSLEDYSGVWRRSEIIGKTENGNILMSDYGHHPTEILLTTKAIKEKYSDKKIVCIFQPHQYNRTLELINDFKNCFKFTDILVISDIYESRDSEEDKKKINSEILVNLINHSNKLDGKGMENTKDWILEFDKKNPKSSIIILQGAGNIDDLRYKIKTF